MGVSKYIYSTLSDTLHFAMSVLAQSLHNLAYRAWAPDLICGTLETAYTYPLLSVP